jgi:hypothetical protein
MYANLSDRNPLVLCVLGAAISLGSLLAMDEQEFKAKHWSPVLATVVSQEDKCEVYHKSIYGAVTPALMIDCAELSAFRQKHNMRIWRDSRVKVLTIRFEVNGRLRDVEVPWRTIASGPVRDGHVLSIVYDPTNPKMVARPNSGHVRPWFVAGQIIAALLVIFGLLGYRNLREVA